MTALSNLLSKDKDFVTQELDVASLGQTVATADSLQRKKEPHRSGTKKGGKKNGDSCSSLGDLFEKFGDSASSFGSDPEEMTMCTADSVQQTSMKKQRSKRGGRKKEKQSYSSNDEKAQHRVRSIPIEE